MHLDGHLADCILKGEINNTPAHVGLYFPDDVKDVDALCRELQGGDYATKCGTDLIDHDAGAYIRLDIEHEFMQNCIFTRYTIDKLQHAATRFANSAWDMISHFWRASAS